MKIYDFTHGIQDKYYKEIFNQLKSSQTKTLILDLRDNPGGDATNALSLYSYLNGSSHRFLEKYKIFSNFIPDYSPSALEKLHKPNKNCFMGDVFVIVNGGSFSASSLFCANLKCTGKAIIVGEETGGSENGCIAGAFKTIKLPHSKLLIEYGQKVAIPICKSSNFGHGVLPHIEIIPTLDDRIKKLDPELNWILEKIKKNTIEQ